MALSNLTDSWQDKDAEPVQLVLTTMVAALVNEIHRLQQSIAYDAIRQIFYGRNFVYSNKKFNRDTDVDWNRLQPYLEAARQMSYSAAQICNWSRLVAVLNTWNSTDNVSVNALGGHAYSGAERSDVHGVIAVRMP